LFGDSLEEINKVFPNYNIEFECYFKDKKDVPPNESQEAKSSTLGVAFYAEKLKRQGLIYFSEQRSEKNTE